MSKAQRIQLRENYMQGWYLMDIDRLLASTAPDFVFDDPREPAAVNRRALPGYMRRWDARMRALGGANEWRLTHRLREDADGILTEWEWWEVVGTGAQGAALILTGDDGVRLERITYFDRVAHRD